MNFINKNDDGAQEIITEQEEGRREGDEDAEKLFPPLLGKDDEEMYPENLGLRYVIYIWPSVPPTSKYFV